MERDGIRCDLGLSSEGTQDLKVHELISVRAREVAELCQRHGVVRLDVFGSAARESDFDPARSDIDLLVVFPPPALAWEPFLDLRDELQELLGRPIDLVERVAVEASRNTVRKRQILAEAELLYAG